MRIHMKLNLLTLKSLNWDHFHDSTIRIKLTKFSDPPERELKWLFLLSIADLLESFFWIDFRA